MDTKSKTSTLLGLMDDSREILAQNGVGKAGEELLAGIMLNEGGRNQRRAAIGMEFNRDAAGLNKLDLAHLTDKQMSNLSGDQKALLDLAQHGRLDLKDAEAVKNAGVDFRTSQYRRVQELSQKTGLTKDEKTELAKLNHVHVAGGGSLSDFRGMSGDRFHEVFDEGQSRFELAQFKKFRHSFERQGGKPNHPGDDMTLQAGIGNATIDAQHQAQLHNNYDLLADYSTSYGTPQIMGLYAGQGLLTSKNRKGEDHTFSLDELKGSAHRLTPNSEDVALQLAFTNMKGIDMGHPPGAVSLATKYNGSSTGAEDYADSMLAGASDYHAARIARDKVAAGPAH